MKRAFFVGLLPATTALVALVLAAPAQAREPVPFPPGTLPANRCGFPVDIVAITNNEYQEVTMLADGTTITRITGRLVVSYTNDVTGTTIVRNVSGPTTETDHSDGTSTFVGRGNNVWTFGPVSQANTGEPGLVFTSGLAVVDVAGGFATGFSISGNQINGCALLAG
jgi:hypothetical protein